MPIRFPLALLVCFATGVVFAADEPTAWKLVEPFYLTVTQRMESKNSILGRDTNDKKSLTLVFKVTPAKKDGGWVLRHRLESLTSEPKNASVDGIAKASGGEVHVTVSADFRAAEVGDVSGLLAKLFPDGEVPEQSRKNLEPQLKVLFRLALRDAYYPIPVQEPVRMPAAFSIPGVYSATGEKEYARSKPGDGGLVGLEMKGKLKLTTPAGEPGDAKRPQLTDVKELSPTEYTGTVEFDSKAGRPVRATSVLKMDLAMTFKLGEREINGTATSTATLTYSYTDHPPAGKK